MITDWGHFYDGPHRGMTRRLRDLRSGLRGMSRREKQHSRLDSSANQAIADERADLYKRAAYLCDSIVGVLEEIEAHVKKYPNGAADQS